MTTQAQRDAEQAREWLADLKPGDTVYCVLRHVTASGMTRWIDLYTISDNKLIYRSWAAAKVMGWQVNGRHDGIKVDGCGMDMGFHLVYSLSRTLFPDGFNDGDVPDRDGGYALSSRWI